MDDLGKLWKRISVVIFGISLSCACYAKYRYLIYERAKDWKFPESLQEENLICISGIIEKTEGGSIPGLILTSSDRAIVYKHFKMKELTSGLEVVGRINKKFMDSFRIQSNGTEVIVSPQLHSEIYAPKIVSQDRILQMNFSSFTLAHGVLAFITQVIDSCRKYKRITAEKALFVGDSVSVIGKCMQKDGSIIIIPDYIGLSKEQIINKLFVKFRNSATVTVVSGLILYALWKKYRIKVFNEKSIDEYKDGVPDGYVCNICMERPKSLLYYPCYHVCSCKNCGQRLRNCPLCREYIAKTIPIEQ